MKTYENLKEIIISQAQILKRKTAYTILKKGHSEVSNFTYEDIHHLTECYGSQLLERIKAGDRAILLLPEEEMFIPLFWSCLVAGVIPVPTAAFSPAYVAKNFEKIFFILKDASTQFIISTRPVFDATQAVHSSNPLFSSIKWILVDELRTDKDFKLPETKLSKNSIAFLQYTSGSTGTPKGVVVSHQNLLHNFELIQTFVDQYVPTTADTKRVFWLPLYHDMGLIGGMLQNLYAGDHLILMKPLDFVQNPISWLNAITKYKATSSAAPNFAFELCANRVTDEEISQLDLSTVKLVLNGAEPIRPETLEKFNHRFSKCGFNSKALCPVYGLAEATLFVTGVSPHKNNLIMLDSEKLKEDKVELVTANHPNMKKLVNCGVWQQQDLKIVDPETKTEVPHGRIGEIWVSGESMAVGYWNKPEQTEETFKAKVNGGSRNYMRTGDLGFVEKGELYISGRLKDLIILRGKNHYPQDIEVTVESVDPLIRQGGVAAFAIEHETEEKLVIVLEAKVRKPEDCEKLIRAVKTKIIQQHEVTPFEVVIITPGAGLKTTSGKIQRQLTKKKWLENSSLKKVS